MSMSDFYILKKSVSESVQKIPLRRVRRVNMWTLESMLSTKLYPTHSVPNSKANKLFWNLDFITDKFDNP